MSIELMDEIKEGNLSSDYTSMLREKEFTSEYYFANNDQKIQNNNNYNDFIDSLESKPLDQESSTEEYKNHNTNVQNELELINRLLVESEVESRGENEVNNTNKSFSRVDKDDIVDQVRIAVNNNKKPSTPDEFNDDRNNSIRRFSKNKGEVVDEGESFNKVRIQI